MQRKHNKELTDKARALRKNMTREEKRLWYDFLRKYPVRFLRQKVIDNYIVDFYKCPRKISGFSARIQHGGTGDGDLFKTISCRIKAHRT